MRNKVSLKSSLEINSSNILYISFLGVNFENLTVKFHVSYFLNIRIKFRLICMLQKLEILTFV